MAASLEHRSTMERVSSSSSDSDESDIEVPWKRRAIGKKRMKQMAVDEAPCNSQTAFAIACQQNNLSLPKKRNTIWCSVLQEQGLTENLKSIGVVNLDDQVCIDRSSESYHVDKEVFESFKRDNDVEMKTQQNVPADVNVRKRKIDRESEQVAWKIIKTLNEPNHDLIRSVVGVIGKEHALDLLHKTNDVEEAGGMMTLNGKRRRTPGGVYIQLLKSDPKLTKEQLKLIFLEENKKQELNKKQLRRLKRQSKPRKVARKLGQMLIENPGSHSVMEMKPIDEDLPDAEDQSPRNDSVSNEDSNTSSSLDGPSRQCQENGTVKAADSELEEGEVLD